ncbi:unnamed protein product, partial [Nesidiocoris tenuis]
MEIRFFDISMIRTQRTTMILSFRLLRALPRNFSWDLVGDGQMSRFKRKACFGKASSKKLGTYRP